MPSHIALLRAINVGGRNPVPMAALRELFTSLDMGEVRTLLQSGNVVFDGGRWSTSAVEKRLEVAVAMHFGFPIDIMVRQADEWARLVNDYPFPEETRSDPGHLVVVFLKAEPTATNVKALQSAIQGPEVVRAVGKQLYAVYPDGIGRSKLTIGVIEKTLGSRGTGRNWNTVLKLAAMVK